MNESLLGKIQVALKDEGLDAWFFSSFHHSDPVAESVLGVGEGHVTRRWFYVIPASGEPYKLCHQIEPHSLDALPGRKELYGRWQDWQEKIQIALKGLKKLAAQYSENGIVPALGRLDVGLGEYLRSLGAELHSSGDLVARFEVTLNEKQKESHLKAMDILHNTVDLAWEKVRLGLKNGHALTEYSIQREMVKFMESGGLIMDSPPIVAVNAHAADPHYEPGPEGSTSIEPGQVLLTDLWGRFPEQGAVYADITWCAWTGESVPDEPKNIFDIVMKARDAGISKAEEVAGRDVQGWEVDQATRKVIADAGYGDYFIHRTGHSIHGDVHANGANMDDYETHDHRRLLPDTLFSVEPGIYLPGRIGFRSEVDVMIEAGRAVVTGRRQTELPALLA